MACSNSETRTALPLSGGSSSSSGVYFFVLEEEASAWQERGDAEEEARELEELEEARERAKIGVPATWMSMRSQPCAHGWTESPARETKHRPAPHFNPQGFTMKAVAAIIGVLAASFVVAAPQAVDTTYPYTGPAVPIGDLVDQTINGNGKGFPRLVEHPAVSPKSANPTNNINVISYSYLPDGVHVHFQTPFGIGKAPMVKYGTHPEKLVYEAFGHSRTYDRTPPCSLVSVTQCSQFFHEVSLQGLEKGKTYYYQIPGGNGTAESHILYFSTAKKAGDKTGFSVAVLNDMGYTNAAGTFQQLLKAVDDGVAFAWHGGDISYADDWYSGILGCADDWPVCYNGTNNTGQLPPGDFPPTYFMPLPEGEIPNQGGPYGGDISPLYESNWDLWQQWINNITTKVPYMVLPGNHEASCAEFDGPNNELTALLVDGKINSTANSSELSYWSCPPSQRNFTAYNHRFRMPGAETGGVSNFWYSFDYGLAHFISFDGETDYYQSPEWPFVADLTGNETHPLQNQTFPTDSGPFGAIDGSYKNNSAYQQLKWIKEDLASIDRSKTPWVFAMSHRPMYSTETSSYQTHMRAAFESLFLEYNVDLYLSGHIHWYERLWPLGANGTIDMSGVVDNNTYKLVEGRKSMVHLINGMAGNIESHSTLGTEKVLNITAVLDFLHYGYSKLTVHNETTATWQYIKGDDGSIGDTLTLIKA
ncbi:acid phosphatase AphA [Dacryopinax primogenitus]|uniref:Purple acid phosphatase n=1 Tax=Dacryopinax primogenitus (strain DJM 731) TaxID=1858805 RepID=M5GFE0_DACPD|nr:acid phosphatase AphA [Dacryopinax primogenitus]EJU04078.1 acid phosphatase AphA [Dacryopinax primogenitus]